MGRPGESGTSRTGCCGMGPEAQLDQSQLEPYLGFHVARAEAHVRRLLLSSLAECGVTLAEYSLLVIVGQNRGANQRQVADALEIAASNMAHLTQRMVRRGLIRRVHSQRDRRARLLSLTQSGKALSARAQTLVQAQEARISSRFSPAEREQLRRLLDRIRTA